MNKNRQILFSALMALLLPVAGLMAQKQSKTYTETYNVGNDAVLDINTSYADIEFDTWNKDQVDIDATVTVEGATEDEANAFFENDPIKIVGNSKQIQISTTGRRSTGLWPMESDIDFRFEAPEMEQLFKDLEIPDLPELPDMPEFPEIPEMPAMPELPPMPPIPLQPFDYDAYQKEGEAYLKQWTKEFEQNFDEDYQKQFEAWGKEFGKKFDGDFQKKYEAWGKEFAKNFDEDYQKRFEVWGKEYEARAKEREVERAERMEERAENMAKNAEDRARAMEGRARERDARREAAEDLRDHVLEMRNNSTLFNNSGDAEAPSIFYFSSDGKNKKYKVKINIKIKMPKSTRLKMNVKHGEVKLAATTNDLNASLRYASLLAATIDGASTDIRVAYSPVVVQKWNLGQLSADYSDRVNLKEVENLNLIGISSNVIIDRLNQKAFVTNNLGELTINSVADTFSELDVTVQNGELRCKLPSSAVSLYLNGTNSSMTVPESLRMNTTINGNTTQYKGFKNKSDSGKMITINSKYSEVVLEN